MEKGEKLKTKKFLEEIWFSRTWWNISRSHRWSHPTMTTFTRNETFSEAEEAKIESLLKKRLGPNYVCICEYDNAFFKRWAYKLYEGFLPHTLKIFYDWFYF